MCSAKQAWARFDQQYFGVVKRGLVVLNCLNLCMPSHGSHECMCMQHLYRPTVAK